MTRHYRADASTHFGASQYLKVNIYKSCRSITFLAYQSTNIILEFHEPIFNLISLSIFLSPHRWRTIILEHYECNIDRYFHSLFIAFHSFVGKSCLRRYLKPLCLFNDDEYG